MPADILLFPTEQAERIDQRPKKTAKPKEKPAPLSYSSIQREQETGPQPEPPRLIPDFAASPIVHALYVRPDLASLLLTARAAALPDAIQEPILPTDAASRPPRTFTRLTPQMFQAISGQLDTQPMDKFSAEKRQEIQARYSIIWEWAQAEGWTDPEPI